MKPFWIITLILMLTGCPQNAIAQNKQTKRVAILETVDKEGRAPYGVKLMVRSKLGSIITETPGYEGYDRVDLASIMNEHEFQRTGLVSDEQIKRLGEMTGADFVLVPEVAFLNDSYVFITAKIINVESALLLRTADVQSETSVNALDTNCRILAGKLLGVNLATGSIKGELQLNNGRYIGDIKNGKPHGKGIIYYNSGNSFNGKSYEGDWVDGLKIGKGTFTWNDGQKYVGAWENDQRDGYGEEKYSDGSYYKGEFRDGKKHGKGIMTFAYDDGANRKYYTGEWLNGKRQGQGTMEWNSGNKYTGNWKNGKLNGKGTFYYSNGNRFEGIYVDGKREGKGTFYWPDGTYETGYYSNDKKNGYATYYYDNGRSYSRGNYVDGKKDGKWEKYILGRHAFTTTYQMGVKKKEKWHKP